MRSIASYLGHWVAMLLTAVLAVVLIDGCHNETLSDVIDIVGYSVHKLSTDEPYADSHGAYHKFQHDVDVAKADLAGHNPDSVNALTTLIADLQDLPVPDNHRDMTGLAGEEIHSVILTIEVKSTPLSKTPVADYKDEWNKAITEHHPDLIAAELH